MAEKIKPFIIDWIKLIGDRRYRRTGGSSFLRSTVPLHSLVGLLALEAKGYSASGLYTFGQPRVADWHLVNSMNGHMGDRGPKKRLSLEAQVTCLGDEIARL